MQKKIYGYARVSSRDQNEDRQLIELLSLNIDKKNIYIDKLSGKDFERPAYKKLVYKKLKAGDLLVVKSIDRLGRNYNEILKEWKVITKKIGADIQILDMPLLNTDQNKDLIGTLIGDIVLQLLSFVAENERTNIRQRQAEGIAAAKQRGVRFGRPPEKLPEGFKEIYYKWKNKELTPKQARNLSGLAYDKFYRTVHKFEKENSLK